MKKIFFILVLFFAAGNFAFAQSTAETTAEVNISLIRGLTITTSGAGTLAFPEVILDGTEQTETIDNEDGQKFLVTGHPNRLTTVTYDATVTLDNDEWVGVNGGTEATLTFTTNTADETGSDPDYEGANPITSGSPINLPNVTGVGTLYIWIGGEIVVPSNHTAQGDYVGDLNVSVAY
jgi:hypothetical protein